MSARLKILNRHFVLFGCKSHSIALTFFLPLRKNPPDVARPAGVFATLVRLWRSGLRKFRGVFCMVGRATAEASLSGRVRPDPPF
jgi:hypothetical protein